jgi:phosphopantothenoylcysteine decarboxylase/phosphopantothenate--cysteine ligase
VGEVTFNALASEPAQTSLFSEVSPIPHTRLGQGADLVVVCPATARLLSDYRTGRSADLLCATLIATRAPVLLAPAMHTEMWEHPSVQDNLAVLLERGVHVVGPEAGRLAGGDTGFGRLADPATVVAHAERILGSGDLRGVSVLITAGGTREAIDPVRVITNRSTGKQGYALAEAAWARGARVTLVSTADLAAPVGVHVVAVETAAEMADAVFAHAPHSDAVVMAAAVADFRPVGPVDRKIKKVDGLPSIELEPTVDILAELGRRKAPGQVLVGFAAETNDVVANATDKLRRKQVDLVVANDVSAPGVGFAHDTNAVHLVARDGVTTSFPLATKRTIADHILDAILVHRVP